MKNIKLNSLYNEQISALNFPVIHKKVETIYGFTNVLISNGANKPALIILHGTNSAAPFALSKVSFLEKNFQVFAIDIPGEPNKSKPVRLKKENDSYGKWLL